MNNSSRKHVKTKRLIQGVFLLLVLLSSWWLQQQSKKMTGFHQAINQQQKGAWVEFEAEVIHLLADDNKGSKHQKFIVKNSLHTILIVHNIDLAPRVPVDVGDVLSIRGEYQWNARGGLVHWTHHDPQNRHQGGWIEQHGKKFK